MARRNRTTQPSNDTAPDPMDAMLSGVRFADEVDPDTEESAEISIEAALPPEAIDRGNRIEEMNRAYQQINRADAVGEGALPLSRRPIAAPVLPPLSEEMVLRLRPKVYRILRSPTASGGYQIPAGVMRVRTPGVSLVELHPGQLITDRDYDVERLRSECGVAVEDYTAA